MSTFRSRSIFKNAYRSDIIRTIIICGGLFVGLWFVEVIFKLSEEGTAFFFTYLYKPLQLPTRFGDFIYQPWSLFTHGFLDQGFWMLFSHMIWLWVFGTVIEDLLGTNRVFPIFWFGTIAGGIVYLILSAVTSLPSFLYSGTIGGVAAVAAAAITFKPKYIFYVLFGRGVPLYVFGIIFLTLTVLFRLNDLPNLIFFLSGAVLGYLSQNVLYNFFQFLHKVLGNARAYFSSNANFIKQGAKPRAVKTNNSELDLNQILDKINRKGMQSLSKKELAYLEQYGR